MRSYAALGTLIISATVAFASGQKLAETLRPGALTAAQERGSSELGCPSAVATVLRQATIEEAQGTGWYEPPHRAEYSVAVTGCNKRATYSVTCDNRHKGCKAGPVAAPIARPATFADTLQPSAIKAAQQSASKEGCPAPVGKVIRQETIEEPATTGWYEPPHRALYRVDVSGCEKRAKYLVTCDERGKECAVAAFQEEESSPQQRQLADELRPEALRAAQAQGSAELGCPEAIARVLRQATIEEPQTTGWYEPPHRALYTIEVSGCNKRTSYVVGCDNLKHKCRVNGSRLSSR